MDQILKCKKKIITLLENIDKLILNIQSWIGETMTQNIGVTKGKLFKNWVYKKASNEAEKIFFNLYDR